MHRRVFLARYLSAVEASITQGDECHAFGQHQRHQKIVAASHFAGHDQGTQGRPGDAAIEGRHANQDKGPGLNSGILQQKL